MRMGDQRSKLCLWFQPFTSCVCRSSLSSWIIKVVGLGIHRGFPGIKDYRFLFPVSVLEVHLSNFTDTFGFMLLAQILWFDKYWVPGSLWWLHVLPHILRVKLSNISFHTHIIVILVTAENSLRGRVIRDCWGKLIAAIFKVRGVRERSCMSACCIFLDIIWPTSVLWSWTGFIIPTCACQRLLIFPITFPPIGRGCPNHQAKNRYLQK